MHKFWPNDNGWPGDVDSVNWLFVGKFGRVFLWRVWQLLSICQHVREQMPAAELLEAAGSEVIGLLCLNKCHAIDGHVIG